MSPPAADRAREQRRLSGLAPLREESWIRGAPRTGTLARAKLPLNALV